MFCTSANSLAFSSAIEICAVNARSRDSSSPVNGPPRLLSTCVTPITFPSLLTIGTHRIDRVKKPVCLSNAGLKRRSAYAYGMLIDLPDVKTAPAMPRWFGSRICIDCSPWPTSDHNSCVFSSLRNSVDRSAFSSRVASPMTRCSSEPSLMSAVTSETISTNSISCLRSAFIRSMKTAPCTAAVPCVVIAARISRSCCVKSPLRLFSAWATPMMSPFTVRIGTHTMLRVTKPVCSSMLLLKRGSEYGSWLRSGSPVVKTWPAMPELLSSRISRLMFPCATREYNSLVVGSFRNSVPRSAPSSLVVISTSACSTSSSDSYAAIRRETSSSSSTSLRRSDRGERGAAAFGVLGRTGRVWMLEGFSVLMSSVVPRAAGGAAARSPGAC
jgi:hypothetical protein